MKMKPVTQLSHEQEQLKFVSRREAESMFQQKGNSLTLTELLAAMYLKGKQDTLDAIELEERFTADTPELIEGVRDGLDKLTIRSE